MAKQVATKFRQSSSLLLLAKTHNENPKQFDYNVLLLERAAKSSFMPSSMVFPGGVHEEVDASQAWLKYFHSFGVSDAQLQKLATTSGPRPEFLTTHNTGSSLVNAIALRITAIRETFEEVGVLLCRDRNTQGSGFATSKENFDRAHWQNLVHNDSTQFLALCQKLDVIPDVWNVHEWSAWLTPSTFKKRFITAFYLTALAQTPQVLAEEHEVANYAWRTPLAYLKSALKKEVWLPPPQFYELSRLLNYTQLSELSKYAEERANRGLLLAHPVQYKCTDGMVHLLPGDDKYPEEPDTSNVPIKTELSVEEFRVGANKLHRSEHVNQYESTLQLNFECPDGQLRPLDPRNVSPDLQ